MSILSKIPNQKSFFIDVQAKILSYLQWMLYMCGISENRRGEVISPGIRSSKIQNPKSKIYLRNRMISLLVGIVTIVIITKIVTQPASARWFNDRWSYRIPVTVNYTGSVELTGFQVKIAMSDLGVDALKSAGKLQSDCADLRFTSADGQPL
ncbi:hypothetical protein CO179_05955, partial [candidate division WWE3 bacterium CG_4_9_14_3_um_filter_39_7]